MPTYSKDPYARGGGAYSKDPYHDSSPAPAPAAAATKSSGGGGFLNALKHIVSQTPKDLEKAALQAPGGLVHLADAARLDFQNMALHPGDHSKKSNLLPIVEGIARSTSETMQHPLRHPGDTLLLGLPAVGRVAKTGEGVVAASRAAKAGEGAKAVVKAAVKPPVGERTLKVGDLEVRGHYSRAAGSRVVQKGVDKALQAGAEKSVRVENVLHKRAAKWENRNQTVADATARAPGTRLAALGAKLKPHELRALRLVAEETPVARRIGAQETRQAAATGKEVARQQERIDLTKGAMQFLDEHPTTGAPVFKPTATKLRNVYEALKAASTDRESMLKNLGLMDEEAQQAAKTKVARVAAGAKTETAVAPASTGLAAGDTVRVVGQKATGKVAVVHGRSAATVFYPRWNRSVKVPFAKLETVGKPALTGAEDITASPDAVFVGNPVERARLTGKPKISSTGTFGHTQKPSSLKTSTGASVTHALERNDVTQIVAERHAEAVRLSKIDRAVERFKQAGETAPRRKDDVWVWTDKLISNERIPKEVRSYLDNPEGLAKLPHDEQVSLVEQIKNATFERHNWNDPQAVADFTELAKDGKGVFVPRRMLGNYAKRDINLGSVPGVHFVDNVNNAQKAGLVYLKLNYPVIQAVSNTAMNVIQQGWAYPLNITRAIKIYHGDPELQALAEDVMGQGAITQAAFEGQGAVARVTQTIAHTMSHKVDTPARLLALYHEARVAGYGTEARFKALLTDPKHAGDFAEVAQRAKEAIVDYSEMSPFERGVVRRLVFVYPWQKGATKYAGHFLRDHPVQAAAAGALGNVGQQQSDQVFGAMPTYLNGLIPAGGGAVNPAGVNFFQTPAQIAAAVSGTLTLDRAAAATGQDFLAPAPGLLTAALTQRDNFGRPLKGNALSAARDLTIGQTPLAAGGRAAVDKKTGAVPDLVRKALGSRTSTKSFPNSNDAYWRFVLGGLYPRQYDKGVLNQNAALQKSGR